MLINQKFKVTKAVFDGAGGISNPRFARIMRGNRWTYWRIA